MFTIIILNNLFQCESNYWKLHWYLQFNKNQTNQKKTSAGTNIPEFQNEETRDMILILIFSSGSRNDPMYLSPFFFFFLLRPHWEDIKSKIKFNKTKTKKVFEMKQWNEEEGDESFQGVCRMQKVKGECKLTKYKEGWHKRNLGCMQDLAADLPWEIKVALDSKKWEWRGSTEIEGLYIEEVASTAPFPDFHMQ